MNIPLNSTTIPNNTIQIKPNRVTPLIGLKCRDFIQSSTGNSVRNRTQVYPTRMSTGSDQLVKVDFLKSPKFQTDSVVTNASGPSLDQVVNIGKERYFFTAGETIHTENSYKYYIHEFVDLAASSGFEKISTWTDKDNLFAVMLFKVK